MRCWLAVACVSLVAAQSELQTIECRWSWGTLLRTFSLRALGCTPAAHCSAEWPPWSQKCRLRIRKPAPAEPVTTWAKPTAAEAKAKEQAPEKTKPPEKTTGLKKKVVGESQKQEVSKTQVVQKKALGAMAKAKKRKLKEAEAADADASAIAESESSLIPYVVRNNGGKVALAAVGAAVVAFGVMMIE
jgi:hypothetical protein